MKLDDAYANAAYIPQADHYPPRWAEKAAATRAALGVHADLDITYGPSERQRYDFLKTGQDAAGTVVFVHGGYWLKFDKSSWTHLANGAMARGWDVALVGYDLCPAVSIADITNQVARAVTQIAQTTTGPINLVGHSAGGHLVARMLEPGLLHPDVLARIQAVAPISPVSDLRPLLETSMNEHFKMTNQDAIAESPIFQPKPDIPVRIWVGADERPVFLEQADALSAAWRVPNNVVQGLHHFDVIDALEDEHSDLVSFLTQQ